MRSLVFILTLVCAQPSFAATLRPFEVGRYHNSEGVELLVEYSRWFGVQVITVNGLRAGKAVYMKLYYNYYKNEFYENLAPRDAFEVRELTLGEREVPHYLDSRRYLIAETIFMNMRVIDLALGHMFSAVTRRGRIVVNPSTNAIVGIDFRISNALYIMPILRPFMRMVTEHPKVVLTPLCQEILRDL